MNMKHLTRKQRLAVCCAFAKQHGLLAHPVVLEGIARGHRGARLDDFVAGVLIAHRAHRRRSVKSRYGLGRRNMGMMEARR